MSTPDQGQTVKVAASVRRKGGARAPLTRCEPDVKDRVFHREVAAEGIELRRRVALLMPPAEPHHFPAVWALYLAALAAVKHSSGNPWPRSFTHRGRRYRIVVTNFGRVRLMDGKGQTLMVSALGSAW